MQPRRAFSLALATFLPTLLLAADLDSQRLAELGRDAHDRFRILQGTSYRQIRTVTIGPLGRLNRDPRLSLMAVLPSGRPMFYITHNLDAAGSVGTDLLWPGGSTGLDLDGANTPGELAVWDGGVVRTGHQEFGGRVTVADGNTNLSSHATHVAGTMVAAGVDAQARGMSPAAQLASYYWDDDEFEMALAASDGLRLSNHSYGWVVGWLYGFGGDENWYWFGDPAVSATEDAGFGFYAGGTAEWDAIAHAAPDYLIVKSAGNDRDDLGPGTDGGHYVWDYDLGDWQWSTVTRGADGAPDGFDTIGYRGNAKNILTVGAVEDIPGGWTAPSDVVSSTFTGWGPTDDGRIKPDLVTNGVALYSPVASSDTDYAWYSGTSMAAPSASGSLNLLRQQFEDSSSAPFTASALKALVIHTADEAGPAPGPDYMFGWGLLNTASAAALVDAHLAGGRHFIQRTLVTGDVHQYRIHHDGAGPLQATLVWTDPAGNPPSWSLDPTTPMLVNDLDLRLIRESDGAVLRPWILNPDDPSLPATTGENHRDNVELVDATGAGAGNYLIEVSHTGPLTGSQSYAVVQTGGQTISLTAAPDTPAADVARLQYAAPNPFNPRTVISLRMPRTNEATVAVFDARGRRVTVLHQGLLTAGEHRLTWDGRNRDGQTMPAGIYLVRLHSPDGTDRLRVTMVK